MSKASNISIFLKDYSSSTITKIIFSLSWIININNNSSSSSSSNNNNDNDDKAVIKSVTSQIFIKISVISILKLILNENRKCSVLLTKTIISINMNCISLKIINDNRNKQTIIQSLKQIQLKMKIITLIKHQSIKFSIIQWIILFSSLANS